MARSERFASMDEVRADKQRLLVERDWQRARLTNHWSQLSEPGFRRALLGEGIREVLGHVPVLRTITGMITPDRATIGQVMGLALAMGRKTPTTRIASMIAGMVLPQLLERYATGERAARVITEVKRSWERIRQRWRERQAARSEESGGT